MSNFQNRAGSRTPFATVEDRLRSSAFDTALDSTRTVIPNDLFKATISISGMSCSSCVNTVTEALRAKPWIKKVEVALLTNSATVTFGGKEHLNEAVETIENSGFDASLVNCEEPSELTDASTRDDVWIGSYSVEGMTCASCVHTISSALDALDYVQKTEVNLLTTSASVVFEGERHAGEIAEEIDDIGFEAKLNSLKRLHQKAREDNRRQVSIRIDGMYCPECCPAVLKALQRLDHPVEIKQAPTLKEPIIKVVYEPDAQAFNIRRIVQAISNVDRRFTVSVHHPPSLEERSRLIQARHKRRLQLRVTLAVAAAVPTFIIGIVCTTLLSSGNPARVYFTHPWFGNSSRNDWALFAAATPVYFFAADIFHRGMIHELHTLWRKSSKIPVLQRFYRFGSMNMLISLGVSIAYFSSIAVLAIEASQTSGTASLGVMTYFDAVVFLTMFLLIGRTIEAYSKGKAGDAVTELGKLRPTTALLIDQATSDSTPGIQGVSQHTQHVHVDLLEHGDLVQVPYGSSPPCDGNLIDATTNAAFDESSLTGESRPVQKASGDEIFAGTINRGSPVIMRVTKIAGESMLDQVVAAVREGQTQRAPIERVADILTSYFTPVVTLIAISVWLIWLCLGISGSLPADYLDTPVGGWPFWSLQFAIAVFVIACPCGIGLAAPTALFVGGGLAAKRGILVKGGGEAFQEASQLDCVVFDKTGTLTQSGDPKVTDRKIFDHGGDQSAVLSIILALEETSSHPIAKAVVSNCRPRLSSSIRPPTILSISETPGRGMRATFALPSGEKVDVVVGNEEMALDLGVDLSNLDRSLLSTWKAQAKSVAVAAMTEELKGVGTSCWRPLALFAIADPLRQETCAVIEALHKRNIDTWMISGDNLITAQAVGEMAGIPSSNIIAGVLPEQKAEKVRYLQRTLKKRGSTKKRAMIAMVGDGINDSPALTAADVGIAIGSGSDVAISSAAFALVSSDLSSVLTLLDLSKAVFHRIKFNFGWALCYNLIALPIAAGVLYPLNTGGSHVRLDPVWASLAMALSSISVVMSSLLLRTKLPVVGFQLQRLGSLDTGR